MHWRQVQAAREMARPYGQTFSDVDGHPAMVVQYVPDLGTGGAAATCQVVSATSLTFQVDSANPAGNDAIGNASGQVLFSAYTTMGAVADYINGLRAWRCYLDGALRADASASKLLTAAAASCIGSNGMTIYHDASSTKHGSFAISGEKFLTNGINGHVKDWDDQVENDLLHCYINIGVTDGPTFTWYAERQDRTSVQTLGAETLADDTLIECGANLKTIPYISAPRGYRLIGRAAATTTYDDIAAFHVLGRSVVPSGSRMVTEKNW